MPTPRVKRVNTLIKHKGPLSSSSTMTTPIPIHLIFFALLFICTSTAIIATCTSHLLFPLRPSDLEWNNAWLAATVIDYYGACLCLCGVILDTEENRMIGAAWSLGCCLLGSPIFCVWIILRLWRHGSSGLRLQNNDGDRRSQYPSVGGID
eukprot:31902_1